VFLVSGIFTVKPNQVAVVLRFGKPRGTGPEQILKPGLHWALPYPVDEIVYIPVGESHSAVSTAGWYYVSDQELAGGQEPPALPFLRPAVDGYTLTGDGNIIHVKATLSYRIRDPLTYVFRFASVTNILDNALNNALFYASARFSVDALYRNDLSFQEAVVARVNELIDQYKLGIVLEPGEVRTSPPLYVRTAFDDVIKAQQEGDRKIRDAEGYASQTTNAAAAEASAIIRDGLTTSNAIVTTVAADAHRFENLLPYYRENPKLFEQRLWTDTMLRVLTNADYKFFVPDRAHGKPWELRLQLGKEPEVPVKEKPKS
jgi:membrane protease subunit HflK